MALTVRAGIVAGVTLLSTVAGAQSSAWAQGCTIGPTSIEHSPNFVPQPAVTNFLDPALFPHAVCTDGTPGAYGFRPGFGLGLSRWVIYLHGGGACTTQATCAPRYNTSKSSSRFFVKNGVPFSSGIGSNQPAQNPDFYDANAVAIGYCSSDNYVGGTDGDQAYPPTDVRSWHFQGRAIVLGVIADLIRRHGLTAGQEVLVGGGSSGGLGMFSDANDIVNAMPAGIRVLTSADAGYAIDVQGFDPAAPGGISPVTPTPSENQIISGNQLWRGRGDLLCSEQATTLQEQQACYSPPVLAHGGFLPPMFIQQSEIDGEQAALDGLTRSAAQTPIGQQYLNGYFGQTMNQSLATVDPQLAFYSGYDGQHVKMSLPVFTGESESFPSGLTTTVADALGAWYRTPCPPPQLIQADPDAPG